MTNHRGGDVLFLPSENDQNICQFEVIPACLVLPVERHLKCLCSKTTFSQLLKAHVLTGGHVGFLFF